MSHLTDRIYCITLGALLHDIGKPLQRANRNNKSTIKTEGAKCMDRGDLVGYSHSLWTSDFLFGHRGKFEELAAIRNYGFENFQKLASKHHKPDNNNIDECIIKAADCASAGLDRSYEQVEDNDDVERDSYIKKPFVSLFTRVQLDDKHGSAKYHTLNNLYSKAVVPDENEQLSAEKYKDLINKFEAEFEKIPTSNPDIFIDAVHSLITRYFWCVPSSTIEGYADIPLSDHCITTAAIAAATAVVTEETGCKQREARYLIVSGDFSGIQKFIFALTGESNRKIAQLLRGRSFMVNLYNILCARMLTDVCGLPALNALTTAGGKFQVLLPDTPKCREAIMNARNQIERWIFNRFYGELKLIIDTGVSFEYGDFQMVKLQQVIKKANESLNREKQRPFASILAQKEMWVDETRYQEFQKNRLCIICGREPGSDNNRIGLNCSRYIDIGRELAHNLFLLINEDKNAKDSVFGQFTISIGDVNERQLRDLHSCYRINLHKEKNEQWPELHYANYVPHVESDSENDADDNDDKNDRLRCKTFEDIASKGDDLTALAVLKADVDNMGLLFSDGFRKKDGSSLLSISRMVSLSRMINWFFAGYLPQYIQNNEKYENIYTLFAGGDDLCLIGRWDTMIEFAAEIQKEFKKYIGDTPAITISAGIELFKPRFPVVRAVDNAHLHLKKSKDKGKNRITLFGYSIEWGEEFDCQRKFAEDWRKFIKATMNDSSENKNAMLYRFLRYHQEWAEAQKNNDILGLLKHRFRFIYDINRNLSPKKNDTIDWRIKEPFKNLIITKTPNMEELSVFKYLPVGITIAAYTKRNTFTDKEGRV